MIEVFAKKLESRATDQLIEDARTAMKSTNAGSGISFCVILTALEGRLTKSEYEKLEDSL